MDGSPPGSSVHGILQARILDWVAISSFKGSSQHRDWTQVSHIAGGFFTIWATGEVHLFYIWKCIGFHATVSIHPTLSLPLCVHKSVLYVCVSIAALQIGSLAPYF